MASDIIAENQTERMIQLLLNGDADAKAQQAALAAVLRTTTQQARELEEIKLNLWKPSDLERAVEAQIKMRCRECPARKTAEKLAEEKEADGKGKEKEKEKPNWLLELFRSESFRYFVLILMFAWALIVVTSGRDNAKSIEERVKSTLSGGVVK